MEMEVAIRAAEQNNDPTEKETSWTSMTIHARGMVLRRCLRCLRFVRCLRCRRLHSSLRVPIAVVDAAAVG